MSLWIFGALCLWGASPLALDLKVLLITFFFNNAVVFDVFSPSALEIPYNFLMPAALLGPNLLGFV